MSYVPGNMVVKYVSDLTIKQKDHLIRIYLWDKYHNGSCWWGEDESYSPRTIESLIRHHLVYERESKWAVKCTLKGIELGRRGFVRTCAYDEIYREYADQ